MGLRVFIVLSSLALNIQAFAQSGYWYQGQFVKLSRMPTSRFYVQSWDSNQVSDAGLKEIIAFGNCRFNNKIKVMKRNAYGFRDDKYFTLRLYALHDCRITRNVG